MDKRDRGGVRTAQDLERKYNLIGIQKAVKQSVEGINKVENELTNFANETQQHFLEMQEGIDENITYRVVIDSSNGVVFKNGDIESTLTAKVYKANEDITDQFTDSQFSWTRVSKDPEGDIVWNNAHQYTKSVIITNQDVYVKAIFNVVFTLQ